MSSSLRKNEAGSAVALQAIRLGAMLLLFAGLVFGTIYCLGVVGDLQTQAETLSACLDASAQHASFCPTDTVITSGEVDNVLNQAQMFGVVGWVCAIGAFIAFLGIVWTLFRRALEWLLELLVAIFG